MARWGGYQRSHRACFSELHIKGLKWEVQFFFWGGGGGIVVHDGWLRGQNDKENNAPNPKLSAVAGYLGPAKIELMKGAGLLSVGTQQGIQ